jgi:serine/threonine-protein kinase
LTGVLPFDGTTEEVAKSHIKREFPKPSMFVTSVPKRIDEIVLKAVDKNPRKRFKTAAEFKHEIELFLANKEEKKSLFKRIF